MGVLKASPRASLAQRLFTISELLGHLFDEIQPTEVAVEQPFVGQNVKAAFAIGEARGIALIAAAARHLPISEYPPASIRETVAGHGSATKSEVAGMVAAHLQLDPATTTDLDATDATAVALCHFFRNRNLLSN